MKSEIKSLAYFRDLGGLKTTDGHLVKTGCFFRSSHLSQLTDEEVVTLTQEKNIGVTIDLRTENEVSLAHDRVEDVTDFHHVPLLSNEDNPAVTRANRIDILKRRMKEGGMDNHITSLYRKIVKDEFSIEGTKKIFKIILDAPSDKGIIYHCTQGKDRTGMTSAFILMALGVDKETIIADYLKFNSFERFKRFWIFVGMTIVFFSAKTAHELDLALTSKKRFIEAAYEEIEKGWGSVDNYLSTAIGLTEKDIQTLRKKYLVKEE